MLEWNVYIEDFNKREIKVFNVFNHPSFMEDLVKHKKKYKEKEEFLEKVKSSLMYYYWSKCEWEITLHDWPVREDFKYTKIDVYDQIMLNWKQFGNYVWDNKNEIKVYKGSFE